MDAPIQATKEPRAPGELSDEEAETWGTELQAEESRVPARERLRDRLVGRTLSCVQLVRLVRGVAPVKEQELACKEHEHQ